MSNINQQQYATQPHLHPQYQYQFTKQNPIFKPPSQNKTIPKQPIFNQQKVDPAQQTYFSENPDVRQNILKRESLPKDFQYRMTSVDNKNKENQTLIQQNVQNGQIINQRDRSSDHYQTVPSSNAIPANHIPNPVNQIVPTATTQNQTQNNIKNINPSQQNQNMSSNNTNYSSQQQNKQLFQQQNLSQNSSASIQSKPPNPAVQLSPNVKSQQQQQLIQQQQSQQQQQQQVVPQNISNQPTRQSIHNQVQSTEQIPINLISDIVKAEIKAALLNFKQEEKIENMSKKVNEFEDKWDQQSLKQLIHVENTQTTNELYQFISELKEDFTRKLTKLQDQVQLNSDSCKSNAYAISQMQEKVVVFSQEYKDMTNQLSDDKKQIQLQLAGIDEKYQTMAQNIVQSITESETKLKKLLIDESIKIEKQVQNLYLELNKRNSVSLSDTNSSPQKISPNSLTQNKQADPQIIPQHSHRSSNSSVNTSLNNNNNKITEYNDITKENESIDLQQLNTTQQSRHNLSMSSQQIPPTSPQSQQQDQQYNYSTRNSAQYSRRSHTELNTSSTSSTSNVPLQSPQTKVPHKYETYVKKYEDFNKEVDNYLQNRKIPAKVQELMNQPQEIKSGNINDNIQINNTSMISPRITSVINRPLITQSPNQSLLSPTQPDIIQINQNNEVIINQSKNNSSSFQSQNNSQIQNSNNISQIQQQNFKRVNYQSLQQNRKAFEDYSGTSINSSTQISPSRIEQVNLEMDSFNVEIQQSHNKKETHNIGTYSSTSNHNQMKPEGDFTSPQKQTSENLKFSIIKSSSKNPQLSMISEQDNEEEELIYQLDDNGYLMDESGNYILDEKGNQVKLTGDQIEYLKNQNILEE